MPLHLLGKKSWNVYNQDSIDRVKRDEEKARLEARDAERNARDEDAAKRLRILRGDVENGPDEADYHHSQSRKRRRLSEDDSRADRGALTSSHRESQSRKRRERPSEDDGNIKASEFDRISNMRLKDAGGKHPGSQKPWYTSGDVDESVGHDVWGNEDTGRKQRDRQRIDASDPLLAMKKGVKQLRAVEEQKAEWRRERERDLHGVEEQAREHARHRKHRQDRPSHDRYHHSSRHRHVDRHDRTYSSSRRRERDKHSPTRHSRRRSRSPPS